MRLEINGALSSSKRTKHIQRRYFFIKDRIADGDLEVQYCPTEMMKSDGLTKPKKQGKAFRCDRGDLMNVPQDYDDEIECLKTHPKLLPKDDLQYEQEMMNTRSSSKTRIHHRSVLGKPELDGATQKSVTWAAVVAGDAPK